MKNNNVSIGNCGEYFVAAELERRGFTVAVPMSNTENFDVLAINRESKRQIAIQVKTTDKKNKRWALNKKCEDLHGENIFYVFVYLNGIEQPEYHIVHSDVVSKSIYEGHRNWLKQSAKNGAEHTDNPMRIFCDIDNDYLNNWDILY